MDKETILVVGTTADYIEILFKSFPDRVVFLTDSDERQNSRWLQPSENREVLSDLKDHNQSIRNLRVFLQNQNLSLTGLVCFDCESLALSAFIASQLSLPFPSLESVLRCRSKLISKQAWKNSGVLCPSAEVICSREDVILAFQRLKSLQAMADRSEDFQGVVLKPLTGSGSELVFLCKTEKECLHTWQVMTDQLSAHSNIRMYTESLDNSKYDPRQMVVMEEFIGGDEYSCDFIFDKGHVCILRIARKGVRRGMDFGSISFYALPEELPSGWNRTRLQDRLSFACAALGVNRCLGMADFKLDRGEIYMLELTPRPGGDCLPPLIQASCGLDILGTALDFCVGKDLSIPGFENWRPVVGLQLTTQEEGIVKNVDVSELTADERVHRVISKRVPGDLIRQPPKDYDSRTIGSVIFFPFPDCSVEEQCLDLNRKWTITLEPLHEL